jgi:hypothetical protein
VPAADLVVVELEELAVVAVVAGDSVVLAAGEDFFPFRLNAPLKYPMFLPA